MAATLSNCKSCRSQLHRGRGCGHHSSSTSPKPCFLSNSPPPCWWTPRLSSSGAPRPGTRRCGPADRIQWPHCGKSGSSSWRYARWSPTCTSPPGRMSATGWNQTHALLARSPLTEQSMWSMPCKRLERCTSATPKTLVCQRNPTLMQYPWPTQIPWNSPATWAWIET